MTGTSLDAVDMAVLETDGVEIQAFGPAGERKLREATRDLLLETTTIARAWPRGEPEPAIFEEARRAVADEHLHAAESFIAEHGLAWNDFDLLGVHGQTVLHERPTAERIGRTVQLLRRRAAGGGLRTAGGLRLPHRRRGDRRGGGAAGPDLSRGPRPGLGPGRAGGGPEPGRGGQHHLRPARRRPAGFRHRPRQRHDRPGGPGARGGALRRGRPPGPGRERRSRRAAGPSGSAVFHSTSRPSRWTVSTSRSNASTACRWRTPPPP